MRLCRLPSTCSKECGYDIVPEIMIPLVGSKKELAFVKKIVVDTVEKIFAEQGTDHGIPHRYHDRDPARCRDR